MVKYGPFWASIGSVYESAVIEANQKATPGQTRYVAIYPQATFTSNMRAIVPNAPWVSPQEREAAQQVIEFLRSQPTQELVARLGLRPGVPGVALGASFTPANGVQPQPNYNSLRPPSPEVVAAMLRGWEQVAKKPSRVVLVVDDSGSMRGQRLAAVQQSLYIAKHTKVDMIWVAGRSPTLVSQNLKATTLTYLAIPTSTTSAPRMNWP